MISREEQHALEIDYKLAGHLNYLSDDAWKVTLFDGYETKIFKTKFDAITYLKRKTAVFQKNKQLGLAIRFHKKVGKGTYLLFPNSKILNPLEVSTFYWNQIQVNVDPKQRATRIDQLVPIKVSFNDIARVSAYTAPKKVRAFGFPMIASLISMFAYLVVTLVFMLAPSEDSKVLSVATGLPYNSPAAIGTGVVCILLAFLAIGISFYPYYKYYKIARDESGGYSYAGKSWKKAYVDRFYANWVAFGLMVGSIILGIMNNFYVSDTIFFTNAIHSVRTWLMVIFLILTDISLVFAMGLMTWQVANTHARNKNFLGTHIDPEDVDLFRAWTTHKRLESKEYIYDYMTKFTFPPSLERLRILSDEIYPKKLRVSDRVRAAKKKDLADRYRQGLAIYKANIKAHNSKQGI